MSDIGFLSMRILLVEDEQKTGDYLKQGLSEAGYITDWVTDGLSGKHQALSEEYDLIILDVMLPKLDGWNIIYDIRKSGKTMPILFLSARDQIEDRVKGLDLGADDYLVKPFAFAELLARIKSLLRRGQQKKIVTLLQLLILNLIFVNAASLALGNVLT